MAASHGDPMWGYKGISPRPGLSGGWYYNSARVENSTFTLPPVGLVWPEFIRYGGQEYTDKKKG